MPPTRKNELHFETNMAAKRPKIKTTKNESRDIPLNDHLKTAGHAFKKECPVVTYTRQTDIRFISP